MDWTQFSTFLIVVSGLLVWNRTESRADIIHIHNILESIQQEIKDFHGRLCAIEERRKEENERYK